VKQQLAQGLEAGQRAAAGVQHVALVQRDLTASRDAQPPADRLVLRELQQRRQADVAEVSAQDLDPPS